MNEIVTAINNLSHVMVYFTIALIVYIAVHRIK